MVATVAYIQRKFLEYNELYFGNSLPEILVRLSNAKGFLGKVSYRKTRKGVFGKVRNSDFVLHINTRIDLPEEMVEDTILHEMIHYYIGYHHLNDTSAHGRLFREMMIRINQQGNRHIAVSQRLTAVQQAQAEGEEKWRVVCVIHLRDGRTGIKVVPRQGHSILRYHTAATARFPIESIQWYLTQDRYFARYPSSIALRIYLITNVQELTDALREAHPILCDGKSVRPAPNSGSSQSS